MLARYRVMTTATPQAARAGPMPQMAMPTRGPNWPVSAPMTGAPIGVPPTKASMYSPITRPRHSGSMASCTDAFAMAWNARLTKPMAASGTTNTAISGAAAAATWSSPNSAAEATMYLIRGRAAAPASSAPAADPIASTTLNRP